MSQADGADTGLGDDIARWVRPEVRALQAYHVPEAGDVIKLDAMENPYPWPPGLVAEWLERLRGLAVNRYPDPQASALQARLRQAMDVPSAAALLLGNGSDELIQMLILTLAQPGRVVMAPEPTFVMYRMLATVGGMSYHGVPLRDDFTLDTERMLAEIAARQPALVFLAYPNNPSGNLFHRDDVLAIIEACPGLCVLDEAYTPFSQATFMSELARYPNLLVMRTVSKLGLAGLRLGILVGAQPWLEEVGKTRLPYNINVLTQASAEIALAHKDIFDDQAEQIRKDRQELYRALQDLDAVTAYPSDANFILFRVAAGQAGAIFDGLRARGILIKNLDLAGGGLRDCLRVTVGTPQENAAFLAALRELL